MPKWVYPLAFLFLLFLIYTDPSGAGNFASGFAAFLVDLIGAVGEFLTGLFQGASGDPATTLGSTPPATATPTSVVTQVPDTVSPLAGSSASVVDSFTHTHDGFTHSHTATTTG